MVFNNKQWIFVANVPCFNDGVQRCLKLVNDRWLVADILPPPTVTFAMPTTDTVLGPATRLSPKQEQLFSCEYEKAIIILE